MVSTEGVPSAAESEEAIQRMEGMRHVTEATQSNGDFTDGQQRKSTCTFG